MRNNGQGNAAWNRPGRGAGKGRGRFRAQLMEPVILLALRHQPAHGYTLLDELDRFGLGQMDPSMLYRLLRDMETRALLISQWEEEETQGPPRRIYRITPQGLEALSLWREHLLHQRDQVQHILNALDQDQSTDKE